MTCEELRIQRNRAYLEYEQEADITQKRLKQGVWKAYCLMYDDAYLQEIKGEHIKDLSLLGSPDRSLAVDYPPLNNNNY